MQRNCQVFHCFVQELFPSSKITNHIHFCNFVRIIRQKTINRLNIENRTLILGGIGYFII